MARLLYSIWETRKNTNAASIVDQGVLDLEQLDKFLSDRGVAMPKDLKPFEDLWSAKAQPEPPVVTKQAPVKKVVKNTKATSKTTTKTTRSTRSKSSIKDTTAK